MQRLGKLWCEGQDLTIQALSSLMITFSSYSSKFPFRKNTRLQTVINEKGPEIY